MFESDVRQESSLLNSEHTNLYDREVLKFSFPYVGTGLILLGILQRYTKQPMLRPVAGLVEAFGHQLNLIFCGDLEFLELPGKLVRGYYEQISQVIADIKKANSIMDVPTRFSYLTTFDRQSCANSLSFSLGATRIFSGKKYKGEEVGERSTR